MMSLREARVASRLKLGLVVLLRCLLAVVAALLKVIAEICDLVAWTAHTLSDQLSHVRLELASCTRAPSESRRPADASELLRTSEQINKQRDYEQLKDIVTRVACRRTSFLPTVFEAVALKLHSDYVDTSPHLSEERPTTETVATPTIYCPTRSELGNPVGRTTFGTVALPVTAERARSDRPTSTASYESRSSVPETTIVEVPTSSGYSRP